MFLKNVNKSEHIRNKNVRFQIHKKMIILYDLKKKYGSEFL